MGRKPLISTRFSAHQHRVRVFADGDGVWVVDPDVGPVRFAPAVGDADSGAGGEALLEAPMPGTVVQLRVESGATVTAGETLVVMESMKMEISIQSPRDGVIDTVLVAVGDQVDRGAVLIELTEEDVMNHDPRGAAPHARHVGIRNSWRGGGRGEPGALASHVDPGSAEFAANEAEHRRLAAELRERLGARARSAAARRLAARHVERGKLLPRDRVDRLLDPGTPVPRARAARRRGPLRRRGAGRRDHRRRRPGRGPRGRGGRQ